MSESAREDVCEARTDGPWKDPEINRAMRTAEMYSSKDWSPSGIIEDPPTTVVSDRVAQGYTTAEEKYDAVTRPRHYNVHPSGVECIQITEHMTLCLGNAVKYIWRAGEKGAAIEDLRKAQWYIEREIQRLTREKPPCVA